MAHTIKHKVPASVKAWIKKEISIQRHLHKKISKEMMMIWLRSVQYGMRNSLIVFSAQGVGLMSTLPKVA